MAAHGAVVRTRRATGFRRLVDGAERTGDARLRLAIPPRNPSWRRDHPARRDPLDGAGVSALNTFRSCSTEIAAHWITGRCRFCLCPDVAWCAGRGVACRPHLQHLAVNEWLYVSRTEFYLDKLLRRPRPSAVRSPHRRVHRFHRRYGADRHGPQQEIGWTRRQSREPCRRPRPIPGWPRNCDTAVAGTARPVRTAPAHRRAASVRDGVAGV